MEDKYDDDDDGDQDYCTCNNDKNMKSKFVAETPPGHDIELRLSFHC